MPLPTSAPSLLHELTLSCRFAQVGHHPGLVELLANSVISWKAAHPHVILLVLLPPLLFEDASSMDFYVFKKVLMSSMILAGPGVGLSLLLTGATTMFLFGFAEECLVEVDELYGVHMVAGSRENYIRPGTEDIEYPNDEYPNPILDFNGDPITVTGFRACDPAMNPAWEDELHRKFDAATGDWIEGTSPVCLECVEGSTVMDQLPISVHLLLGGMLAATDPVAVCAVLNDLGCPAKLNYMIAGESLLNDGTAVVAFLVLMSVAGGCDTTAAKVIANLITLAGGGVVFGLLMAALTYNFIKHLRNPNIEITAIVFATLATFRLAEHWHLSGVLATVVFGVQTARTSFLAMDEHTHHASHAFWSEVGYTATSVIFILAGVKSQQKIQSLLETFAEDFDSDAEHHICAEWTCRADPTQPGCDEAPFADPLTQSECMEHHVCLWSCETDDRGEFGCECHARPEEDAMAEAAGFHVDSQLTKNLILWVIMTFIRAFVVFVFSPILRKVGYGLTVKEAAVMVWGGLRGAVSLSLALLVDQNHLIGPRARELIFIQTTGIVTLTLVVNGTTAGMVYKWLEVYPPNPYRPALATQGLRNIQQEMDKTIRKLAGHWFHSNADMSTLTKLMPNFEAAHMLDGDLVNVKQESMEECWVKSKDQLLQPTKPPTDPSELPPDGIQISEWCPTVNADAAFRPSYRASFAGVVGNATIVPPNAYAHVRLVHGETSLAFETDVAKGTHEPAWNDARHTFELPPGDGEVLLYMTLYDNDFGEMEDEQIGQCWLDVTALCAEDGDSTQTLELKADPDNLPISPRGTPVRNTGTVQVEVSCTSLDDGKVVEFSLLRGKLYPCKRPGGPSPRLSRSTSHDSESHGHSDRSSHGSHDGHHGDHGGHGHGHGGGHVNTLRNIKRWLAQSEVEIDHSFAMYEIMLSGMRTHFAHKCEGKTVSVEAFSKLSGAVGRGLDVNDDQMHDEVGAPTQSPAADDARVSRATRMATSSKEDSPLDAMVDHVIKYTSRQSNAKQKDPRIWFKHKLLSAEMLLVLIEELVELADNPDEEVTSELGGLYINAADCCRKCKQQLAELQVAAPNTYRAVHTLLAFGVVAAEFRHRVHVYQDQGFFNEVLVENAEFVMAGRSIELAQYFDFFPGLSRIPFLQNRKHAVFYVFEGDSVPPRETLPRAADTPPPSRETSMEPGPRHGATEQVENPLSNGSRPESSGRPHGGLHLTLTPTDEVPQLRGEAALTGFQGEAAFSAEEDEKPPSYKLEVPMLSPPAADEDV